MTEGNGDSLLGDGAHHPTKECWGAFEALLGFVEAGQLLLHSPKYEFVFRRQYPVNRGELEQLMSLAAKQ